MRAYFKMEYLQCLQKLYMLLNKIIIICKSDILFYMQVILTQIEFFYIINYWRIYKQDVKRIEEYRKHEQLYIRKDKELQFEMVVLGLGYSMIVVKGKGNVQQNKRSSRKK